MSENQIPKTKIRISPTEEIEIPLHFDSEGEVPAVLSQHMLVQGVPDNILLTFYQAIPPVLFNPSHEQIEKLKEDGYWADCIARVAVPVSRFAEFAKVIAQIAEMLEKKESENQDANSESDQG